jgi:hypothetical protein
MTSTMQDVHGSLRVPRCALPCTGATFPVNWRADVAIVGLGTFLEAICDVCLIGFPVLLPINLP